MTGAVLIADGNRTRAEQIGTACAARGFATSLVPHGAAALEAALSDAPDVVVAPTDLALIDGPKLAEILRANPRTQEVRFLLLGRLSPVEVNAPDLVIVLVQEHDLVFLLDNLEWVGIDDTARHARHLAAE